MLVLLIWGCDIQFNHHRNSLNAFTPCSVVFFVDEKMCLKSKAFPEQINVASSIELIELIGHCTSANQFLFRYRLKSIVISTHDCNFQ